MKNWMIYGANGYTASLIAREAKAKGLKPILAGRNREACEALAKELELPVRIFNCSKSTEMVEHLKDVSLVLHCAGPFSKTSRPMIDACLQTKTSYLDITGEISVFEDIHQRNEEIRAAGIVAMPGVGFDVVPTDCLALMLKEKMPDAVKLSLGFKSPGTLSPGTAKTMIEGLGESGAVRKNGVIIEVPPAYGVRKIRFDRSQRPAMTIPWGDVSTAFYSTGIPDIAVYMAASESAIRFTKLSGKLKSILATGIVQSLLKKLAGKFVVGPGLEMRSSRQTIVWGEVENAKGDKYELRLTTPESYQLTVYTALNAAERVLNGGISAGATTPSQAFGSSFILTFPGVQLS
ncbi:MAG: saccharopine dehydrogenase NADP-binding domain-containing protein [Bdellovibrionota bacterium]